jgi:hypothetical protein
LLPTTGFQPGTLVEWVAAEGSGASTLALLVGRAAQGTKVVGPAAIKDASDTESDSTPGGGALVIVDRQRRFYPPAAARMALNPQQLIVLCPDNLRDHRWALVQALGCPGVAAVVDWSEKLDGRTFRRLQLAAEAGNSLGLLVRPLAALGQPSWSQVQLLVRAVPSPPEAAVAGRRVRVEVIRAQGEQAGRWIEVEINDETHAVHLASTMATPTSAQRPFANRRAEAS